MGQQCLPLKRDVGRLGAEVGVKIGLDGVRFACFGDDELGEVREMAWYLLVYAVWRNGFCGGFEGW